MSASRTGEIVRPARDSELDQAGELCVAAYRAGGHLPDGDPYTDVLRDARARARTADVLVLERQGAVIGTVTVCPPGSPLAEIGLEGELEFRFLAVDPEHWGTGAGPALVDACDELARAQAADALVICVISINQQAMRMYARLGFHRLPERDWSPREGVSLLAFRRAVTS